MSDPIESTRDQTPEDIRRVLSGTRPVFAAGEAVPGLSSWLLERKLGGGGFGEVWLARHAWDAEQKPRAVKFCTDPAARHRLVTHEKNVVLRVMKYAGKHPNIIPLLDCNLDGDVPWLMYEFVEGGTLAGVIEQWRELPLPQRLDRAVRTLHAIAGALGTFHRFDPPLVHRDMKPQNVLMASGVPRITDFGIGSVVLQPEDDTATGAMTAHAARLPSALHSAGTRRYAPPEQTLGSTPSPRDDVYALGIIAYQMVMADLMTVPGTDAVLELRDLKVPGELAALVVNSVAVNPERRPKDATEWETALAAIVQKSPNRTGDTDTAEISSKPVLLPKPLGPPTELPSARTQSTSLPTSPESHPVSKPVRRNRLVPWVVASVLLFAGLGATVLYFAVFRKRTDPTPPEPPGGKKDPPRKPDGDKEPKGRSLPKPGETRDIEIAPGVKMTFCWIPAGKCQLGSPKAERDAVLKTIDETKESEMLQLEAEEKRGTFKTDGFWMGKYEVTQAEWRAVMESNPSSFDGKKRNKAEGIDTSRFPVESVSWREICNEGGFLTKINAHGGIQKAFGQVGQFRLPHEDEWEYACRGGRSNEQPFYWGDKLNGTEANCIGIAPYGTAEEG